MENFKTLQFSSFFEAVLSSMHNFIVSQAYAKLKNTRTHTIRLFRNVTSHSPEIVGSIIAIAQFVDREGTPSQRLGYDRTSCFIRSFLFWGVGVSEPCFRVAYCMANPHPLLPAICLCMHVCAFVCAQRGVATVACAGVPSGTSVCPFFGMWHHRAGRMRASLPKIQCSDHANVNTRSLHSMVWLRAAKSGCFKSCLWKQMEYCHTQHTKCLYACNLKLIRRNHMIPLSI